MGDKSGPIVIAGMLTVSTQVVADADYVEPLTLTATAKSSISGTWTVIDDDEIALALDINTLNVEVDPSDVVAEGNAMLGTNNVQIDSLKPSVSQSVSGAMKRALAMRYASIRHLDDVKVKGPLLKFEIGKMDCVFTRQGAQQ